MSSLTNEQSYTRFDPLFWLGMRNSNPIQNTTGNIVMELGKAPKPNKWIPFGLGIVFTFLALMAFGYYVANYGPIYWR